MREKLQLQDADKIVLQRVHRLPSEKKPRPIIVRFMLFGDRIRVWEARSKLKKSGLFIYEDLPKEYANRRRILYPVMQHARSLGHHAIIKADRILIDGQSYTVSNLNKLPMELQPASAAVRRVDDVLAFFTGATPLSNFYKTNLAIDDRVYSSVEQYFQYSKALFAEKPDKAQKILSANHPAMCKRIGDSIDVNKDQWLPEAKRLMLKGCTAKFDQDQYARTYLAETNTCILGEASKNQLWGIGMTLNDKNIAVKENWSGQNLLGVILMRIRSEL
jgi:ribA/ribD-fused uncharacterized protein